MSPRVAIVHDGFVPAYRVPLYDALAQTPGIDYVVFHSDPPADIEHLAARPPFDFEHRYVEQHQLGLAGRPLIHQRLVREIVQGYDAVVLGAWMRFVSSHAVRAAFTARRRPVIYWGHGGHVAQESDGWPRPLVSLREGVKLRLARSVDSYLVYTAGGAAGLIERGVDPQQVFVLGNTLDMSKLSDLRAEAQAIGEPAIRASLGVAPETPVVVYLGRFVADKRVADMLDVARAVNGERTRPAEFVLIGGGPDLERVRDLAAAVDHVRVPGPLDDREVAHWLACASAVAIPGRVGLVANHAIANGVPVVARVTDLNAPEVEYLEHGRNGLLVDGDTDAFAEALAQLIDSPARRRELADGALASASALDLGPMVGNFDQGVRAALAARGRIPAGAPPEPEPLARQHVD